jgi:hypothetical protein
MRKYLLLLTILFFAAVKVFPQTTVTIESSSQAAGSITVPINVSNFNDVSAISFKINYDENVLTFNSISDAPVAITASASGGVLSLGWFDATASQPVNISSGTLLNLNFTYTGGQTSLSFDVAQSELANSAGNPINAAFVNGTILELGSTIELSVGDISNVTPGAATSVDVSIAGALGFTGDVSVGAISIKLNYDTSVLTFNGISSPKDPAVTANAAGGVITISWFDATGTTPIVFNTANSLLAKLDFTYNSGYSDITFNRTATEIADGAGSAYSIIYNDGSAGDVIGVSLEDVVTYVQNAPVTVPINVTDFNNVGAISIKIQYNAAVLTFTGVSNAFDGITFTTNSQLGVLTLGWFDATGTTPLNIGDGTLVELNFDYATGQSFLNFNAAQSEIADGAGTALDVNYTNGSVSYTAPIVATIKEIQTPTGSDDASPYVGQVVTTTGIVTAIDNIGGVRNYWIQDGTGPYSGVYVFDLLTDLSTIAIGDRITVTTMVMEYFNLTELNYTDYPIGFTKVSSGNPVPAPSVITTGDFDERYEGVLVTFLNAEATSAPNNFWEWTIDDGSGTAVVDDQIFRFTPEVGENYNVTGVGTYNFNAYKAIPRSAADIVVSAEDLFTWWEIGAGAAPFLQAADNATRGMAFNHVTNHILVASRSGKADVHVLDGNTGQKIDTLDMTGVTGQLFPINHVSVADDGVIYGTGLSLNNANFKIYRWEDEDAVPTVAFEGIVPLRAGDSFVVVGSGPGTVIYASGSGNTAINQYTTVDGVTFTLNKQIPVPAAGAARGGIAPVSDAVDADIWINQTGGQVTLIATDGTVKATIPGTLLASSFWTVAFVQYNGDDYIGVTSGNSDPLSKELQIWKVTDPTAPLLVLKGALSGAWNANSNAVGAIDLFVTQSGVLRAFSLVTNNGIAAYATEEFTVPAVELQPLWASYLPDYFGANTERGAAYGFVGEQNRFYVVSREGGPKIAVHDAKDGSFIKNIPQPEPPVGFFPLNVADVSDDGVLFVSNGVPFGFATDAFTVYRYDSENSDPDVVVSYMTDARIGDMFSVSGRTDDNSVTIYAGKGGGGKVVKFTTSDNGYTFTPEEITLAGYTFNTNPNVQEDGDGNIWAKSYGSTLQHFLSDGTFVGEVPGSIVGTSVSKIKYFEFGGQRYIACYYPNVGAADGFERAEIINVTGGAANAVVTYVTPSIGNAANTNGSGVVDVALLQGSFVLFIQGANNGIGAFAVDPNSVVWPAEFDPTALASISHTTTDLSITVYNDGRIGDVGGALAGVGIDWKGQNGLWRAAPVWGRTSVGNLSGAAHNNGSVGIDDLTTIFSDFRDGFDTFDLYDQVTEFEITDGNSDNPYGLPVTVATLSRSNLNSVVFAYSFDNTTAGTIEDMYSGLFLDFDVDGNTYTTNTGGYSEGERLVYVFDQSSPYYYGVAAVYGFDGYNATTSNVSQAEFEAKGLEYISTPDPDGEGDKVGDIRVWIGSKVPNMAPGQTGVVAFVISAGDNLFELRDNIKKAVDAARIAIDDMIIPTDVVVEGTLPTEFSLDQNYPNPFNPTTTIKFGLPSNSQVKLRVYNLLGETVAVLADQSMAAGYHSFNFDASRLASGVYFYSIEAKSLDSGKDFNVVKKMMLLK